MDPANYTNPPPLVVPVVYRDLTEIEFIELCQEAGGMTDDQLVACQSDPQCTALWIKFRAAPLLSRSNAPVQKGLTKLGSLGYLPNGVDIINAMWPM